MDRSDTVVRREHPGYVSAVVVAITGAIAYAGPWVGYWEQVGLVALVGGVGLLAAFEVLFRE